MRLRVWYFRNLVGSEGVMTQRKTRMGQLVDAAARASEQTTQRFHPATVRNVTLLAFLLALVGVMWGLTQHLAFHVVIGLAAMFLGVVSGWAQLSFIMNQEIGGKGTRGRAVSIAMTILSVLITVTGVVMLFVGILSLGAILYGALAGFVMVLAVSLIVAPWWITLVANLGNQEAQAARDQMRSDFTARLHDSVLQTLALIQLNSQDPQKVSALAHAQERDLREWLYGDAEAAANESAGGEKRSGDGSNDAASSGRGTTAPADGATASPAATATGAMEPETVSRHLKKVVAHVEDTTERQMEVVTVGDRAYSKQLDPLMSAAREAMINAAHHGAPPYSVYMEISGDLVQIFVRDHGEGFDTEHLPAGHLGVSESILGRMKRNGGTADIDSRPGWGTEVKVSMRLERGQNR
jgi:signal transduction histidine kinase